MKKLYPLTLFAAGTLIWSQPARADVTVLNPIVNVDTARSGDRALDYAASELLKALRGDVRLQTQVNSPGSSADGGARGRFTVVIGWNPNYREPNAHIYSVHVVGAFGDEPYELADPISDSYSDEDDPAPVAIREVAYIVQQTIVRIATKHDLDAARELMAAGQADEALRHLDRAARLRPSTPSILALYGDAARHAGRDDLARSLFAEAR